MPDLFSNDDINNDIYDPFRNPDLVKPLTPIMLDEHEAKYRHLFWLRGDGYARLMSAPIAILPPPPVDADGLDVFGLPPPARRHGQRVPAFVAKRDDPDRRARAVRKPGAAERQ